MPIISHFSSKDNRFIVERCGSFLMSYPHVNWNSNWYESDYGGSFINDAQGLEGALDISYYYNALFIAYFKASLDILASGPFRLIGNKRYIDFTYTIVGGYY